jgi:hypothetical protein
VTVVTDDPGPRRDTVSTVSLSTTQEHTMFKNNVGGIDRIVRIIAGLALIGLTLSGTIGAWGWIGVVPLLTAALGTCPLYTVLGFNTCPMKKA